MKLSSQRKALTWLVIAAVLASAATWWWISRAKSSDGADRKAPPTVPVVTASVVRRDVPVRLRANGSVVGFSNLVIDTSAPAGRLAAHARVVATNGEFGQSTIQGGLNVSPDGRTAYFVTFRTAGDKPVWTSWQLRAFDLDHFFDLEIGGYGADVYPKGSQLIMCATLAQEKYQSQIAPDATVYIADSSRDVEAARIAGIRCVAVASGRSTVGDLRGAGADVVLTDLSDTAAVTAAVDRVTGVAASR